MSDVAAVFGTLAGIFNKANISRAPDVTIRCHTEGDKYRLQAEIKRQFEMHHSPNCVLDGVALRLDVCFTLATPKSQKMQYSKLQGKPHIIRPDTSNMIKYIEDVCSGLIYRDDALISRIVAYKRYGLESYTEFKITVIE